MSVGAHSTWAAMIVGTNDFVVSFLFHTNVVGSHLGGSESTAAFQMSVWKWACLTCSSNDPEVGGRHFSLGVVAVPFLAVLVSQTW